MILFLGAGASKPFGIPTMVDMSNEFENKADGLKEDVKELYWDIKAALNLKDLEDILTVLNTLSEKQNPLVSYLSMFLLEPPDLAELLINRAIPSLSQLARTFIDTIGRDKIEDAISPYIKRPAGPKLSGGLKLEITKFIRRSCIIRKEEELKLVYNKLFDILRQHSTHSFNIFTTNYDLVIDKYIENLGVSYYGGFKNGVWHPEGYTENVIFKIFKLHGSIDQCLEDDRIIKRDNIPLDLPAETVSGAMLKELMIYPMREKKIWNDPFFELFIHFKKCLELPEEFCVVIGYSFEDEHIRNIFFDAVKRNPEIRIFMLDPQAEQIRNDLEPIKGNIEPIEGEFGEESVFEDLKQKVSEM